MSLNVEKCIQAWTNSLRQMNSKADIVFFGDSLTYYGDFASVFPNKVVCNLGLRGDTIQGLMVRVEQVKMLEPRRVFLMSGINDVASLTPELFENQYDALIRDLIEKLKNVEIIVQSLLPVNDIEFNISCNNVQILERNTRIHVIAKKYDLAFIDLFSLYATDGILPIAETIDGIHLFPDAYHKWKRVLLNYSGS